MLSMTVEMWWVVRTMVPRQRLWEDLSHSFFGREASAARQWLLLNPLASAAHVLGHLQSVPPCTYEDWYLPLHLR